MKSRILGVLIWVIYRVLSWTWRVRLVEPPSMQNLLRQKTALLMAHWHGDELVLLQFVGHYRIATMASTSKDGEIMNTALHLLGAVTTRGSSTRRGATGLRGLVRLIKQAGRNSSFAVDGPKGPLHKVKPGIFEMSRLVQAPIYAAGVACDRAWHFSKSWNQTYLPKPFAKIVVWWGEALPTISSEQDPRSSKLSETLENALHYAQKEAQKNLAATFVG